MPWLDCHDVETTLMSLAGVIGVGVDVLAGELHAYDEARLEDQSEDPYARMPREVLKRFGVALEHVAFDGAYYFHGTRVLDRETFRDRGILPLDQVIEELWHTLYDLVSDELNIGQWRAFRESVETDAGGHSGHLYRMKTRDRLHYGPYGLLVREIFFEPGQTGSHDYLGCPEIVQDIAGCCPAAFDIDLRERYCSASVGCIVKFGSPSVQSGALRPALWYAFHKLREDRLTSSANWSFDGHGKPVPFDAIIEVEFGEDLVETGEDSSS